MRLFSSLLCLLLSTVACAGPEPAAKPRSELAAPTTEALAVRAAGAPQELLPNGILTDSGLLLGGQPTLAQLEAARSQGYTTVVNLRTPEEGGPSAEEVEALGLAYHSLPVAGVQGLTEENARTLAEILDQADGPTIVHCASGNRVGALLALEAWYVDGMEPAAALELGRESGMARLEPAVRQILGVQERATG